MDEGSQARKSLVKHRSRAKSERPVATEVVNRQRRVQVDLEQIARLAERTLAAVGRGDATLTIAFVSDPVIRRLNRDYRGKDRPTDVLSFPLGWKGGTNAEGEHLGDVVISTDSAIAQAEDAGFALERELGELVIHGVLHLCGYDHETDQGDMNRLELKLRRKLLGA
jgi:probable rRNA maturation factor